MLYNTDSRQLDIGEESVDLWISEGERQTPTRLTLLCQTHEGYLNLSRLVSQSYLEGDGSGTARAIAAMTSSGSAISQSHISGLA